MHVAGSHHPIVAMKLCNESGAKGMAQVQARV
jgi:hypothetical protein